MRDVLPGLRVVFVALVAVTSSVGCHPSASSSSPQDAPGAGGGGGSAAAAGGSGALGGDASLNRFVITSKDEGLVLVDAASGAQSTLYRFDRYANVVSVDPVGGTFFVGAQDNSVDAIDSQSGRLLWSAPVGRFETDTLSSPRVVVSDGVAYAAGVGGALVATDTATGAPRWTYALPPSGRTDSYFSAVTAPTVAGGRVYIATYDLTETNYVHAIDANSGRAVWKFELAKGASGRPTLAGDTLLVPALDLIALDAATGEKRWSLAMNPLSRGAGAPAVRGDDVLVQGASAVGQGNLYSVSLASGQVKWMIDAGIDYAGLYAPLIAGDVVLGVRERGSGPTVPAGNGEPIALRISDGAIVWKNERVSVSTSPVLANGRLFFQGQNFDGAGGLDANVGLISLDATTGAFVWVDTGTHYGATITPVVVATNGVFRNDGASP